MLNDAWGGADPELVDVAAEYDAAIICTHTGGVTPRTRPHRIEYADVVASAIADTTSYAERALAAGVARESIVIDPAHDFGKTTRDSLDLTRRLDEMVATGWPVLVSLSNKDFVGESLDLPVGERLTGTLAASAISRDARSPHLPGPRGRRDAAGGRHGRRHLRASRTTSRDPGPAVIDDDTPRAAEPARAAAVALRDRPRPRAPRPRAPPPSTSSSPTALTARGVAPPVSELNQTRGVTEPLGHRIARHLLGEHAVRRAGRAALHGRVAHRARRHPFDGGDRDGRRLGLPRREGARPPAPGRDPVRRRHRARAAHRRRRRPRRRSTPTQAHELWCEGAAGFHVLAEVARGRGIAADVSYADAPYGVAWWVARWDLT